VKKKRRANGLRRGPLTDVDKKYIEKNAKKGAEYIAEKIKRKPESISDYLYTITPQPEKKPEPETPQKCNEQLISTMGVHRKGSGIVIMTPAASQISDEIKQKKSFDQLHKFRMRKNG
jgi:hypothetical protein